jgi:ubiquinone/menaquinone biosynthesis C-methylase UbiE
MVDLNSNAEWKLWGKEDPLWAVASWANKQKEGASAWTDQDFYALGESDWKDFFAHWQQYGVRVESCLEIGCGAGRLTKQLATTFASVYAVDVSEDMISLAKNAVGRNVEFSLIDGLHLPYRDRCVKAVFSAHVLQHLDSEGIGFFYFREFFRVLDANGTLMVHLPLYQFPMDSNVFGAIMRSQYSLYASLEHIRASLKRRFGVKIMRGTPYSIRSLTALMSSFGFRRIEFRVFPVRSNGEYHSFVLATK